MFGTILKCQENILGQICPQFFIIWIIFAFVGIKVFDWIRFNIEGGIKPVYNMFKWHKVDCDCIYCRNEHGELVLHKSKNMKKDERNKRKIEKQNEQEFNEMVD